MEQRKNTNWDISREFETMVGHRTLPEKGQGWQTDFYGGGLDGRSNGAVMLKSIS